MYVTKRNWYAPGRCGCGATWDKLQMPFYETLCVIKEDVNYKTILKYGSLRYRYLYDLPIWSAETLE